MSKIDVTQRFYGHPLLVDTNFARYLHQQFGNQLTFDRPEASAIDGDESAGTPWLVHAGQNERPSEDGLSHIYISGTLIHGVDFGVAGYFTGYDYITDALAAAEANPTVSGIVLHVDSHGGEVSGCFECADSITATQKPITAIVGSYAHSAAYALASRADNIAMPRTGSVGSVGVVTMHVDYSEALDKMGVKPTMIFSGAHKVDGHPYAPLADGVKAEIQARLDDLRDVFVESVATGRGIEAQVVYDTDARTYGATDALSLGLADAVMSPSEALTAFKQELFGSNKTEKGVTMSDADKGAEALNADAPVDAGAVAAEARSEERARIQTILTSEEASGRSQMANHLAFETEMSAEDATKLLASAPQVKSEPTATKDSFAEHMDADDHPEVGDEGADAPESKDALESAFTLYDKVHGNTAKH